MNHDVQRCGASIGRLLPRPIVLGLLTAIGWLPLPAPGEDGAGRPADPAVASSAPSTHDWAGTGLEADVAWLIGDVLAGRSLEYQAAVEEVFRRQVAFCDGTNRLERVTVRRLTNDAGETRLWLESPGREELGDTHAEAMTLRDGAVVGLSFVVESAFDSCPCCSSLEPDYLDDEFLKTIALIDTLEVIDLATCHVTDKGAGTLARMRSLKSVDLRHTNVTANGVAALAALPRLERLWYSHADHEVVAPARLCMAFARHPALRDLDLESVEFTREAAAAIASCPRLEELRVVRAPLEAGALEAFAPHERIASLVLYGTTDAVEPIVLRGMPALTHLSFQAAGANVEIVVRDLPALRSLLLFARRDAAGAPDGGDAAVVNKEVGHAPRVSVDGLGSGERAYFSVQDLQSGVSAEPCEVRLGTLPSLSELTVYALDGRLDIQADLPALTSLEASKVLDSPSIFRSLSRCPNLEVLKFDFHGHALDDGGKPRAVEAADIGPVFALERLKTLSLFMVRGRPLTFEPFLRLSRLRDLELKACEIAESFEVVGHPTLEVIRFVDSGPRHATVRDMPRLSRFGVVDAEQLQTATLADCPALRSCWCTGTPNLATLDLRRVNAEPDVTKDRVTMVLPPAERTDLGGEAAP